MELNCKIYENDNAKAVRSKYYNYNFDKNTGYFERWGRTIEDDPQFSPLGPELIDIEITDICYGPHGDGKVCDFCYKSNTPNGNYMDFSLFKKIFDSLPRCVTQIAFGVDSQCKTNPDVLDIMQYSRDNGVVPNVTVANIDQDTADKLSKVCGSVAVSRYDDKELCYESLDKLIQTGMDQVNIHSMISKETLDNTYETIDDYINGRLKGVNAIILLSLKQKGRGAKFNTLSQKDFDDLVEYAFKYNVPLGFDSCSVQKLENTLVNYPKMKERLECYIEPCESSTFSFYCNTDGYFFPCSFVEGEGEWKNGIHIDEVNNFINDVWYSNKVSNFRYNLLKNGRSCPIFNI